MGIEPWPSSDRPASSTPQEGGDGDGHLPPEQLQDNGNKGLAGGGGEDELQFQETLEVMREEVTLMELPAPVHYPPCPPGDIDLPSMLETGDKEELEEGPMTTVTPSTPSLIQLAWGELQEETQEAEPVPAVVTEEEGPSPTLPSSFSFACGGWLQFWLWGVGKALQDMDMVRPDAKVAGCSAGALTAVGLFCPGSSYEKALAYVKNECIPAVHGKIRGPFLIHKYARGCLSASTTLAQHWEKLNGRMEIAVTKLPEFKSERITRFTSFQEAEDALVASAAAVPFAAPARMNGSWYIDGGLSDFQPLIDEDTVTISPLYFSKADIKPSRYVPAWWAAVPPKDPNTTDWLYDLGYCDALRWMRDKGYHAYKKHCTNPQDVTTCRLRPARRPHPFDKRTKSLGRFLGYGRWPRLLDAVTWLLVGTLWRTLVFVAIYGELLIKFLVVLAMATLRDLQTDRLWPPCLLVLTLVMGVYYLAITIGVMVVTMAFLLVLKAWGLNRLGADQFLWKEGGELASCLLSLSLWLRSIPVLGTRIHLRKHHTLFRQSFFYRVFLHIL